MPRFNHVEIVRQTEILGASASREWRVEVFPFLKLRFTDINIVATLTLGSFGAPQPGQMIWVAAHHESGAGTGNTIVWPTGLLAFSSAGDAVPTAGADSMTLWSGFYDGNDFLMTKTAYPGGGFKP